MIAFREKLVYRWNQPDIYFVALLKPLTFDIKLDPNEIGDAKWMKIVKNMFYMRFLIL